MANSSPDPGSVWHYLKKFDKSLGKLMARDLDAFLLHTDATYTCSNAVAALLWEPAGVAAFCKSLRAGRASAAPDHGSAPPEGVGLTTPATTQELRRALLAACSAVEKLRDEEPDVYASDYGTLVGDKVVRLLGVAVTATRLGVIRTASEREYRQATQRLFILGNHGNKYVEVEDDTSLLAWVEAFKKPWQCEMRRLKTFAWRGTKGVLAVTAAQDEVPGAPPEHGIGPRVPLCAQLAEAFAEGDR